MSGYRETVVQFDCQGERLLGVAALPPDGQAIHRTGVVIVVGGPQYRAGSHRQFVLLARSLAAAGFAVLRFDYRGMGDSEGAQRDFQSVTADIGAAIMALMAQSDAIKRIALWGLCDGASAALLYSEATRDPRLAGLCLLNPWVRSESSLARAQVKHYYTQRLFDKSFWKKLLSGRVGLGALGGLIRSVRRATRSNSLPAASAALSYQERMALAWRGFKGQILLLLSGVDLTAKEFLEFGQIDPSWAGALKLAHVTRLDFAEADHTFSDGKQLALANAAVRDWLLALARKED
ncbi:hydrolase 1, exosortase A system-associated [Paucibacter sp. XJ19-41]|uniref:hydrolase 1, exosortase A system-associated n=1 Tax=Paucibacter sp. XJ19-41 TaxID=2927824 RepID=UPI002349A9A9|nr:hydrolase 1, exosortase A system-associated [Paucibacter sp. XJ19-41]MDC6166114.1 hydrolase 1, exosortase A system-associated [Paucibacter sp. XJ19-41]